MQKVEAIDKIAEIVEDNNMEVQYRLELIDEDRPYTLKLLGDNPPGDKIRDMMDLWDQLKIESNDDIDQLQVFFLKS